MMAAVIFAPFRWSATLQRFQDIATGRFVANEYAQQFLRISSSVRGKLDVAFRDPTGQLVPSRFAGGDVISQHPTGKGDWSVITRRLHVSIDKFIFRSHDMVTMAVTYLDPDGIERTMYTRQPMGQAPDSERLWERFRQRRSQTELGEYGLTAELEDISVISIEYHVATYYESGEYPMTEVWRFGE